MFEMDRHASFWPDNTREQHKYNYTFYWSLNLWYI